MGQAMRDGPFAILIVEDEMLLVLSLEMTINAAGYRVVGAASTGEKALEIAKSDRPDLALVDVRLAQGESGLDVAKDLKVLNVPSLLMTGNKPRKPLPEIALGCLSKPFSDESLLTACNVVFEMLDSGIVPQTLPLELELY